MDETLVWFNMPSNSTVHKAGEKTIFVKTTGHEKSHFTVVLSCMANGKKVMPMVIFKRKLMPKEKFPKGIIVHVHPKGGMDEEGCKIWIAKVWGSRPGGLKREKSISLGHVPFSSCRQCYKICSTVEHRCSSYPRWFN